MDYTIYLAGYNPLNITYHQEKKTFYLEEKIKLIDEILIKKYISSAIEKNEDGSYTITPKNGGTVPGLIEPDVLQTMLYLPGINSTNESISNINVRSGTHDQNLILWNGIKLYQTGHFFGLISTINPYLSNEIKIYKNASPAVYGEGISSVVDISTDTQFTNQNKYSFGINMLNADIYAKVNISKKTFVEVAARKSFTEFLQTPTYDEYFKKAFQNSAIIDYTNQNKIDYYTHKDFNFYDITTKVVHKINDRQQLTLDFITIDDQLDFAQQNSKTDENASTESSIYQRNFGTNLSWKNDWNNKNTTLISIANSQYELDSKITNLAAIYDYKSQENYVFDNSLKILHNYKINNKYSLNAGYQFHFLDTKNIIEDKTASSFEKTTGAIAQHAFFGEISAKELFSNIDIMAGLRTNYFATFHKTLLEPRFQFTYHASDHINLNILGEIKSQAISQQIEHQTDFFGIEKRWWVLANNTTIPIQKSHQVSFGIDYNKKNWLITFEAYYKKVLGINSASQGFQNQFEYTNTIGSYQVQGVEFLIQKKLGHFLNWANYNFGKSTYDFPEFSPSVFQNNFQLNHFVAFGSSFEKKGFKIALGSKWHSGKPETNILHNSINYSNTNNPSIDYSSPNSNFLENFSQIDASASYHFKTHKNTQFLFSISVLNILNTKNEINEYYKIDVPNNHIEQIKTFALARTFNASFRISF